jgi:hypothetical protein
MAGLYAAVEMAEMLGIDKAAFYHQLQTGCWPRPKNKVGRGRRCYYVITQKKEVAKLRVRMNKPCTWIHQESWST